MRGADGTGTRFKTCIHDTGTWCLADLRRLSEPGTVADTAAGRAPGATAKAWTAKTRRIRSAERLAVDIARTWPAPCARDAVSGVASGRLAKTVRFPRARRAQHRRAATASFHLTGLAAPRVVGLAGLLPFLPLTDIGTALDRALARLANVKAAELVALWFLVLLVLGRGLRQAQQHEWSPKGETTQDSGQPAAGVATSEGAREGIEARSVHGDKPWQADADGLTILHSRGCRSARLEDSVMKPRADRDNLTYPQTWRISSLLRRRRKPVREGPASTSAARPSAGTPPVSGAVRRGGSATGCIKRRAEIERREAGAVVVQVLESLHRLAPRGPVVIRHPPRCVGRPRRREEPFPAVAQRLGVEVRVNVMMQRGSGAIESGSIRPVRLSTAA